MENQNQPVTPITIPQTTPPVSSPPVIPKSKLPLILGGVVLLLLVGGGVYYVDMKRGQSNNEAIQTSPTTMLPPNTKLNDLGIVYGYMSYSTKTQSWSDSKKFIADLANSNRQEVNRNTFADFFSPSGTHFARITKNSIETAINNDPTTFKKIVDISDRNDVLGINYFFWSKDETKLAYELRINKYLKSEAQYWTINYDGSNPQMIGNIIDYPGGFFLGYDFDKSIAYATENHFGSIENKTLVALYTKTNQLRKIMTLPIDTQIVLSPDYATAYYTDNNKTVTSLNLATNQKKKIFDSTSVGITDPFSLFVAGISPNNKLFLISVYKQDGSSSYKYILNTDTNSIDTALNDSKYSQLSFYSFSPNSNYVALFSRKMTIPDNDPKKLIYGENAFYSGKYCIWDIANKKIIPFFNCNLGVTGFINEKVNEDISFNGWIQHTAQLTLSNNQIPTPTPTLTLEPRVPNKPNFIAKTNNIVRTSDITALIRAIELYKQDNNALPSGITTTVQHIAKNDADICMDLTPTYIGTLPRDPLQKFDPNNTYSSGGYITDCSSQYETGFTIVKNTNNQVTISAPLTQQAPMISITK